MRGVAKILATVCLLCATARLSGLDLPTEWDFGFADDTAPVVHTLEVRNDEAVALNLRFVPTCACLEVDPATLALPPGGSASVMFVFDPAGYAGGVVKTVLVRIAGRADLRIVVLGTVVQGGATTAPPAARECSLCPDPPLVVRWYQAVHSPLVEAEVARLTQSLGSAIYVRRREVGSPAVDRELAGLLSALGLCHAGLPVIAIGETVLQGEQQILGSLAAEIARRTAGRVPRP